MPFQEHIYAHQFLLLGVLRNRRMFMRNVCWGAGVAHGFELLWLLTKTRNDGTGELFRADLLLANTLGKNIVGMDAVFERAQPGVVHEGGNIGLIDMDQHHSRTQEQARGIGDVLTCAARCGTVNGLEHGAVIADVGGTGKANGTGYLRRHVGEDIAVQVWQHDHVKCLWRVGELGRANIDDPCFVDYIGILHRNLVEHAVEEAVGQLHDVIFHEAGDFLAVVAPGILKGVAHDLLAAGTADEFEALHHIVRLAVFDARVQVLFIFTDDHHIHFGVLGLYKGVVGYAGAHIGVQPEGCARGDVEAFVASALWRGNGGLEKYLSAAQRFPGAGFDASVDAAQIDLLANLDLFDLDACSRLFDDMQRGVHNFWSDAVSSGD